MAYNPNNPNGQATMANSAPVVIASNQANVPVYLANQGAVDTFGKIMISQSYNDIDLQFFRDDPNNILLISATSGIAGTASGYAQFSTTTVTSGSVKGVSLDKTHYHSGGELYCMFTAAYLSGGLASSFQRLGLYDNNNGFFVGYEGTTFGITVRNNGADTQTAKASWNVDTLTGGSTSKFTRNGTPEAINLALSNIYRIRFGWLGAACVRFEVASPDGEWVLFHIIRQPNSSAIPHIANADLPMTIEVTKVTAGAGPNLQVNTNCWGAGIQYDSGDWSDTSTLSTVVNSFVDYNISGLGSGSVYIGTTATGTIIFEVTIDGKNWFTHPAVIDPNITGTHVIVSAAFTPLLGSYYLVPLTGYKGLRLRTVTTLSVALATAFVGDTHDVYLPEMSPSPHNIGFVGVHKDAVYSTAQASTLLWQPSALNKRFVITDITITTGGTVAGVVTLYDGTYSAAFQQPYVAGTPNAIFRGEFAPSSTSRPGVVKNFVFPYVGGTASYGSVIFAGNSLLVNTSAAINPCYVQVNGYEI